MWLEKQFKSKKLYNKWIERNIAMYFAVGSPFLGSPKIIKSLLVGNTFGLPIPKVILNVFENTVFSTRIGFNF